MFLSLIHISVVPYNEYTGEGTGFSFKNYNADDMMHVLNYAMDIYYNKKQEWNKIVKNAMNADFSWDISAQKYIDMSVSYTHLCKKSYKKAFWR